VDGTAWIRPDLASKALADRLSASAGTATLVIEQLDRDGAEQPVLLTWEHYLADTFEFVIHRRGPGHSAGKAGLATVSPVADGRPSSAARSTTRATSVGGAENHSRGRTPAANRTRRRPQES
jgi:hypothetical protein